MSEQDKVAKLHQRLQHGALGKATGLGERNIKNITDNLKKQGVDADLIDKAVADQVNQRTGSS